MSPSRETMSRVFGTGLTALAPISAWAQGAAGGSGPPPAWRFQVTVDGTWYENVYFTTPTGEEATWGSSATAALAHTRRFRTGSFSISGYGGMLYYPEAKDLDQATYGGALGLGWAASPRTQISLSQTYSRSNTRELRALDPEALPVPTSGVNNASTAVGLSQRLTRRLQLSLGGTFTFRRYDSSELAGGEQLGATVELGHATGKYTSVYLAYGYTRSWLEEGRGSRVHVGGVGARRQLERGLSLEAAAGIAYIESVGQFHPTGRLGLSARGRRTSFDALYHRDFGQAFGYGRDTIADLASVGFGWTPVERLSFSAGYSFGDRRDPTEEGFHVRSHALSAGFGWGITRHLSFGARYGWEQNETEGAPKVSGSRATASLSYGVDWR